MCTLIAFLGYLVAFQGLPVQNLFPLNNLIPKDEVNPASDLIQFSLIFWVIYIMTRLDFENISIKRSKERKVFLKMIQSGGEFHIDALVSQFQINNVENYRIFLKKLTEKYPEIKFDGTNLTITAVSDSNYAYNISYDFGKWLNS